MDIIETIKEQIANNAILLYMKGSPNAPQCGFSSKAAQVVMACGEKFAYVDILQNPEIRANLPKYANWPTFPQLWVGGELVGAMLAAAFFALVLAPGERGPGPVETGAERRAPGVS